MGPLWGAKQSKVRGSRSTRCLRQLLQLFKSNARRLYYLCVCKVAGCAALSLYATNACNVAYADCGDLIVVARYVACAAFAACAVELFSFGTAGAPA